MASQLLPGIMVRRYLVLPTLAGSLLGILLALMSLWGLMDWASPLDRGIIGAASSAILGVLVAPAGAKGEGLTKTMIAEAALVSMLSTLVVWPVAYSSLAS